MDGLHHLIAAGKVLYLGASDMPAWIVADANRYARETGKTPFVIYQGAWSVLDRSFEREIIPMARAEGRDTSHRYVDVWREADKNDVFQALPLLHGMSLRGARFEPMPRKSADSKRGKRVRTS